MKCFRLFLLSLALGVSMLMLNSNAAAVDGVVLINQATATNGLPGCPHSGFPIIICTAGSYRLSGNQRVPDANTDAIDVSVFDVTIDLNGFTISGPVTCKQATYPVQCSTSGGTGIGVNNLESGGSGRNMTVRNGTIRGMGLYGVYSAETGTVVDGVRVEWTGNSIVAGISVFGGIVTRSAANTNAGSGIVLGTGVITLSTATYNGGDGFVQPGAGGTVLSNSSAGFNGQDGIYDVFLAVNNTSMENVGYGLRDDGNGYGYVTNVFYGNNSFGADVTPLGTSIGFNLCSSQHC